MSIIKAVDDLVSRDWEFEEVDLHPTYADLQISFTKGTPIVEFDNLSFGYELLLNDEIVSTGTYPPANIKYVRSDQPYLISIRLTFIPDETYSLKVWAENGGEYFEDIHVFSSPIPSQPYPSWTWENKNWNPPVPYPEDGFYSWNEDEQQWDEVGEDV